MKLSGVQCVAVGCIVDECSSDDTGAGALRLDSDLAVSLQSVLESAPSDAAIPGVRAAVVFPDGAVWTGADGVADRACKRAAQNHADLVCRDPIMDVPWPNVDHHDVRALEQGP